MQLGRLWMLTVGFLIALLMAAVWCCFRPPMSLGAEEWLPIVLAAATCGLLAAVGFELALARYRSELRRLAAYLHALGGAEARERPFRSGLGLQRIADTASHTVTALRQRHEVLAGQKRELEVQLRLCDAERRHGEAVLNSIADAVLVTDAFNELTLANEAAAKLLKFEVAPALRRPVDQVISDPGLVQLIKDTREGGDLSRRRHVEHRRAGRDQQAVYDVSLACVAEPRRRGPAEPPGTPGAAEPAGVVTILRDVTREREISEMKSDFVSAVSHELRTPLSSIKAYMEMLIDGEAADEATRAEFYNIIQGEANRLSRLIENILNVSRIESGVVKVQREYISLPALVREVVDVMQPQARARQIELSETPTPAFFQVLADRDMIYQAILNLVSNAIKYTNAGGRITVAIHADEQARTVRVAVTDTGVGIPPEALPHLFVKFYRVPEHKKLAKGTGLGLNLVRQIVEGVHGGTVSVASALGKGSTFAFTLPLAGSGY